MSDGVRIELENVPDADAIARRVQDAVERRMKLHAADMRSYAKLMVPFRTGRLQQSISTKVTTSSKAVTITIGANARSKTQDGNGEMYGPFVEYGTGQKGAQGGATYDGHTNSDIQYNAAWPGMEAQPFIRPAVYDMEDLLVVNLKSDIKEAMK